MRSRIVGSLSHSRGMPSNANEPTLTLGDMVEELGELARLPLSTMASTAQEPFVSTIPESENPSAEEWRLSHERSALHAIKHVQAKISWVDGFSGPRL